MAPPEATKTQYEELCVKLREMDALRGVQEVLVWDEYVMMPENAIMQRGVQKSALAGVLNEKETDSRLGELLKELADAEDLSYVQKCVVREASTSYRKASGLTKALAQRKATLETEGQDAWVRARKASDFSIAAPVLQEIIQNTRDVAAATDPHLPVYAAALDEYEKNMSPQRIDEIFGVLREQLPPLIAKVRAAAQKCGPDASWLQGKWDVKLQSEVCDDVCKSMGFDTTCGRIDVSAHPMTMGIDAKDVRITTRYKPDDVTEALTGAVHECGHALYELGRSTEPDLAGLPAGMAISMGVHESQSLLWERMVALSSSFASFLLPKLQQKFPEFGPGKGAQDLYKAMNTMKDPSMIRVESDELTYPMHIVLRYEIERALLEGSLEVADVPATWAAKMREYLGCDPPSDAMGCLQDPHWYCGNIGYFPTYTLGAIYAVQLFRAAERDLPTLHSDISEGRFAPLREWLLHKVHRQGSLPRNGDELMQAVTGEPVNVNLFVEYLREKYSALYSL